MNKTVFVLEDESILRSTLGEILTQNGYNVQEYSDPTFCPISNVQNSWCNVKVPCADFIITDINMPRMNGLKFIENQMQKGCIAPHVAVMSAVWSEDQYQKARELGCKVFEKPFGFIDLLNWMKECENQSNLISVEELNSNPSKI